MFNILLTSITMAFIINRPEHSFSHSPPTSTPSPPLTSSPTYVKFAQPDSDSSSTPTSIYSSTPNSKNMTSQDSSSYSPNIQSPQSFSTQTVTRKHSQLNASFPVRELNPFGKQISVGEPEVESKPSLEELRSYASQADPRSVESVKDLVRASSSLQPNTLTPSPNSLQHQRYLFDRYSLTMPGFFSPDSPSSPAGVNAPGLQSWHFALLAHHALTSSRELGSCERELCIIELCGEAGLGSCFGCCCSY